MTTAIQPPINLSLISPELSARLIADVRKHRPELTDEQGRRGVYAMVGYLTASASTYEPLSPSKAVDDFWHAFVLRTVDYAVYCERAAGRFLHHVPDDEDGDGQEDGTESLARTVKAVRAAGFRIDSEFWPATGAAECGQCHAGCHDSPTH
ncbi:glycine-rich domain-containing protein (plasmid) [Streptomyces sp. BI20]|uniref:glycine-rich domain-containing protein n=1 Tax=Streptomyces sp. BI20 TaxID=3403460 RepID=UPI003C756D2D